MNSLLWAIILIIIGVELLLKVFFKTSFSLFKLAIAGFCIYTGLNMLHQKNPDGTENKITLKEQLQKSYDDGLKVAQALLKKAHKASYELMDEINQ